MADENCAKCRRARSRSLIADCFVAAGLPGEDAARCAALMTEADLTGADGHGIFRLAQYVRRLKASGFNERPNITVTKTAPATALVDGDNGMGHLVMSRAANEAIAHGARNRRFLGRRAPLQPCRARRALCGNAGGARHGRHLCRGRQCQSHGDLGRRRFVARHQSARHRRAVGRRPLVLDMATSIVAYGTVKKYALRGLTMPEGWFVNPETGEADHRSEAVQRRHSAADGRIQRLRPRADDRASRRRAQRRRVRPRRRRFQCRRRERDQYRAFHRRDRHRALSAAARFSPPRSTAMCAICAHRSVCPASMKSACLATAAPNAATNACATACRSRAPLMAQLDKLADGLQVKPLRERYCIGQCFVPAPSR